MTKPLKKILIVDDNNVFVETLSLTLKYLFKQIEIESLSDGKFMTSESLLNINADIIILDISMPIIGGLKALQIMRDNKNETPVLMLSMHDEKEYLNTARELGANGFLLKDSDIDLIKFVIEKIHSRNKYFMEI
ncbi:response regulator transcription factor [Flavobacteriaceae bacterium]|nr:response regulator transcription factor [Flavobacteriaceae bacterium]